MKQILTMLAILCYFNQSCSNNKLTSKHGNNNALWTGGLYLMGFQPTTGEPLTDEQVIDYCKKINLYKIETILLFAGPYDKNGKLPSYPFSSTARETVQKIKRLCPKVRILPWIGGIQDKTVFLDDSNWVKNAISDTKMLFDSLKVDGIHLDFEYILKSDSLLHSTLAYPNKEDIGSI